MKKAVVEKQGNTKQKKERKPGKSRVRERKVKTPRAEHETSGTEGLAGADTTPSRDKWYLRAWKSFAAGAARVLKAVGRWFLKIWVRLKKWWEPYGTKVRRYVSPTFLVMVGVSFLLWYLSKLGHTYTTELPVNVNIEGRVVRATVVAEGVGYRLVSYRNSGRKNVDVRWGDLEVTPSATNPQAVVISAFSLQNIISLRNPDLRVISMGNVPEVEL